MRMEDLQNQDSIEFASTSSGIPGALSPAFAQTGLEPMLAFKEEVLDLNEALLDIESFGGPEAKKKAQKLIGSVDAFEPSITMIGQIKAGKTSLVNAMIGRPEFLPADVNPWTSVVTSLHLNNVLEAEAPVASFQFFNSDEWDHLVENGGRIGELSSRAGAEDELKKVREQIAEMREKTKKRLGRKFELLLGQTHNYRHLDDDLIQRYVCMGDDFDAFEESESVDAQGLFADITKSADIYLAAPTLPMPLCIRDTPGVNDTFMMREQITINALRGSRICVVVLSANQALSSMDMGLIRLISNVKSREVVIFVNRVDELANPERDIPEIRDSILKTLADNNGPDNLEVLFGSAYWANMALTDAVGDIVSDSAEALRNLADDRLGEDTVLDAATTWKLSGLPELYTAIAERIAEGEGAEMLKATRKRALNHLQGLQASSNIVSLRLGNETVKRMDAQALAARLDTLEKELAGKLNDRLNALFDTYAGRIDQSHKRFLDRALASLLQHLETKGEKETWQYSPDGLRLLLRSSYQMMRKKASAACEEVYRDAAARLTQTYTEFMDVEVENFVLEAPEAPQMPPPVTLGQTIALDLQGSWWSGWWKRRRGYANYADSFYKLIEAETAPIINDLKTTQAEDIRRIAMSELDEFVSEQCGILTDISHKTQVGEEELKGLFGITAQEERDSLFEILFDEFSIDEETPQENVTTQVQHNPAAE